MKKDYIIRNPLFFQGEKYLKKNKNYFEGWYFKNTYSNGTISFIPGICINEKDKMAFIQIITDQSSYFIFYDIDLFSYNDNPFFIQIQNNYFSFNELYIDIHDEKQKIDLHGKIKYSHHQTIKSNLLNPNIMGPFSFIPFMECHHALLSMKNSINGDIYMNGCCFHFINDTGYIEKDWGISFPKNYIWLQGNHFHDPSVSFMLSIADIPFHIFQFKGLICILIINHTEYRFTTYNISKIIKLDIDKHDLHIILKKKHYQLEIISQSHHNQALSAPIKGQMIKTIKESVSSTIQLVLKKNNQIIFSDKSIHCGMEIVNNHIKA